MGLPLPFLDRPPCVRRDIPDVAGRVSYRSGPFAVLHVTHRVKAHRSGFEGAGGNRAYVANREMDARRKPCPFIGGAARLDDATLDPEGRVHRLPGGARRPLVFQFLCAERRHREGYEPVGIVDGKVCRDRDESRRNMGGGLPGHA